MWWKEWKAEWKGHGESKNQQQFREHLEQSPVCSPFCFLYKICSSFLPTPTSTSALNHLADVTTQASSQPLSQPTTDPLNHPGTTHPPMAPPPGNVLVSILRSEIFGKIYFSSWIMWIHEWEARRMASFIVTVEVRFLWTRNHTAPMSFFHFEPSTGQCVVLDDHINQISA